MPRCASQFTGKERDTETGLDYFGARYYGSNMGRWMSPDWSASPEPVPYANLENPQTLNLYGYVQNNPATRFDLDGHRGLLDWLADKLKGKPPAPPRPPGNTRTVLVNNRRDNRRTVGVSTSATPAMHQNPTYRTAKQASDAAAKASANAAKTTPGREWGAPHFQIAPGVYSYSDPVLGPAPASGQPASVDPDAGGAPRIPFGTTLTGYSHSHPPDSAPGISAGDQFSVNLSTTVYGRPIIDSVATQQGTVNVTPTGPVTVTNIGDPND